MLHVNVKIFKIEEEKILKGKRGKKKKSRDRQEGEKV
jgi:hypothetical protein